MKHFEQVFYIAIQHVIIYIVNFWLAVMELFLSYILPGLGALLALQLVQLTKTDLSVPKNQNILLLIAHPDDEAMFFGPTVISLTRPNEKNNVEILCLSSGKSTHRK